MVEVAPAARGQKLVVPAFKYIVVLLILALIAFGVLCFFISSRAGAKSSRLEELRCYLPVFSVFGPNLKPEDNLGSALKIHGFERFDAGRFYVFFSATNKDGSPITSLSPSQVSVKLTSDSSANANALIKSLKPLSSYSNWAKPLSLAAVIDNSGSMLQNDLQELSNNYEQFFNSVKLPYEAAVFKFSTRVNELQGLTSDKQLVVSALKKAAPRAQTALYDAICEAISKLKGQEHLRLVILSTDGTDNKSLSTLDNTIRQCLMHGISVFTLGFGWLDAATLHTLSDKSDGYHAYVPKSANLAEWFKKLADIINNVYVLELAADLDMNAPKTLELNVDINSSKLSRTKIYK